MTASMRKMSAGDGYKYLLRTVVVGDGDRWLSTPLTRYYAETGTPPGRWMGTGDPLGRAYPVYQPGKDGKRKQAVAGYDFTFSIPKSASALWAVADAGTQAIITDAHHAAVADTVSFMEREVAATRAGARSKDGAVAQVDVTGLIATATRHGRSRRCRLRKLCAPRSRGGDSICK